jgi:hypothetical protein
MFPVTSCKMIVNKTQCVRYGDIQNSSPIQLLRGERLLRQGRMVLRLATVSHHFLSHVFSTNLQKNRVEHRNHGRMPSHTEASRSRLLRRSQRADIGRSIRLALWLQRSVSRQCLERLSQTTGAEWDTVFRDGECQERALQIATR